MAVGGRARCGRNVLCVGARRRRDRSIDDGGAEPDDEHDIDVGPDVRVLGFGSLEGQDVVVWFWAEW